MMDDQNRFWKIESRPAASAIPRSGPLEERKKFNPLDQTFIKH